MPTSLPIARSIANQDDILYANCYQDQNPGSEMADHHQSHETPPPPHHQSPQILPLLEPFCVFDNFGLFDRSNSTYLPAALTLHIIPPKSVTGGVPLTRFALGVGVMGDLGVLGVLTVLVPSK